MGAEKVFSVITEFKFDIQSAIVNSDALQDSLKSLEGAADKVHDAFRTMGQGMLSALGISLGAAGILGTLHKAIGLSDDFQASTLDFTAQMGNSMNLLQGNVGSFADRLAVSKTIMKDIADQADRMDLSGGDLLKMVQGVNPQMLANYSAGKNYTNTIGLSSQALSLAPSMGLGTESMKDQLSSLLGGTSTGGALFQRMGTTPGMKGMKIEDFVGKDFQARLKLIQGAFGELSKDMGDVADRGNMLSTQLGKLKELFLNLLRPIGDAIKPIFVDALKTVNGYLKNQGAVVAKNVTELFKSFLGTPAELYVAVQRWRHLRRDVNDAGKVLKTSSAVAGVGWMASFIPGLSFLANPLFGFFAGLFQVIRISLGRMHDPIAKMIASALKWAAVGATAASVLMYFGVLGAALSFVFGAILVPLAGLTVFFQAMTKAAARADLANAATLAEWLPWISDRMLEFKIALFNVLGPVDAVIDGLSYMMQPLFELGFWFTFFAPIVDAFIWVLKELGREFSNVAAFLAGVGNMLGRMFSNANTPTSVQGLSQGLGGPLKNMPAYEAPTTLLSGVGESFGEGFDDYMKKYTQRREQGKDVSKSVTNNNIAKVEITNDLKEGMEPDRIAFTIRDQLLNANTNKGQSRNRSLGALGVGNQ